MRKVVLIILICSSLLLLSGCTEIDKKISKDFGLPFFEEPQEECCLRWGACLDGCINMLEVKHDENWIEYEDDYDSCTLKCNEQFMLKKWWKEETR